MPESKIPMGARFIAAGWGGRRERPDPAGDGRNRRSPGKVGKVGRDIGLEAGEQVIEREQYQPVLCSWRLSSARTDRCDGR